MKLAVLLLLCLSILFCPSAETEAAAVDFVGVETISSHGTRDPLDVDPTFAGASSDDVARGSACGPAHCPTAIVTKDGDDFQRLFGRPEKIRLPLHGVLRGSDLSPAERPPSTQFI